MQPTHLHPDVLMRYLAPLFAAAVLATACSNNDLVSPNHISGRWDLATLNGSTLPYAINSRVAVNAEQLTLNDDGTYNDVASYTDGTTFNEVGYYTVNNNEITFQDQTDGITYRGSISGDVLTEINGSFTAVYQRE